jgi:hypothetical protein
VYRDVDDPEASIQLKLPEDLAEQLGNLRRGVCGGRVKRGGPEMSASTL